ncbi:hypothetical protein [Leuconostoc falkenbergense]|jgi:hypothetical protein|uniref:hypothetical protein n=1 Tax=Leuconostoc falkenbergense TaxID=2766470 RepID=UPI00115770B3|nr:hypothetical protein [Leuconostoc falkenbergense]MCT4390239.1 hypothetical protein [Leuconostoc falkenbergense]MCT4411610.1 hypothetical protein [Leuconostoc falkenbergense]VTU68928.1 hypothetical protein AMBR_MGDJBKAP_02248 [Leuconostoc pseudomesenteroides]
MPKNKDTQYRYVKTQIYLSVKNIIKHLDDESQYVYSTFVIPSDFLSKDVRRLWKQYETALNKIGLAVYNLGKTNPDSELDLIVIKSNTGELDANLIKYDTSESQAEFLKQEYKRVDELDVSYLINSRAKSEEKYFLNRA